MLAREAVVRFVQDFIAHALDRQKRNADKNGRANVLSFKVNDLVLLSTINLPRHAVTCVGSSNNCRNKLVCFVCCTARAMHTRSIFHVGSARILRFMLVVAARTISTRPLARTEITGALKNPQQILVITNKTLKLVLRRRGLATSRL